MCRECDEAATVSGLCRYHYDRKRRKNIYEYLDAVKLARGCTDCGYREHAIALDFDHVRGKKLRNLSQCRTMKTVKVEIEKCEVRCANCHRIKTWERLK